MLCLFMNVLSVVGGVDSPLHPRARRLSAVVWSVSSLKFTALLFVLDLFLS